MGWVMGFEPTNTGTTIRGLNRLATPTICSVGSNSPRDAMKDGTPGGTRQINESLGLALAIDMPPAYRI